MTQPSNTFKVELINAVKRPRSEANNPFWQPEREMVTVEAADSKDAFIKGEAIATGRGGKWMCNWATAA